MKWAWRLLASSLVLVAGALLGGVVPWGFLVIAASISLLAIWGMPSMPLFVLTAALFVALAASFFIPAAGQYAEQIAIATLVSFVAALTTLTFEAKRTTSDSGRGRKYGLKDLFRGDD